MPTPDGIDDLVWIGGPSERLGLCCVVLDEEAVDGCLQVDEGMKHAAIQSSLRQFCEKPSTIARQVIAKQSAERGR